MGTSNTPTAKTGAAAKALASRPGSRSDAIALLTKDHKEVKQLFRTYEKIVKAQAQAHERQEVARQICEALTAHATIEEEIFYPALREQFDTDKLLDEAEVEHATVKDLIAQIEAMNPEDDLYDAKVIVMGEYVEHHVQEEEGEIFPKAVKSKIDLVELGSRLKFRKEELLEDQEQHEVAS